MNGAQRSGRADVAGGGGGVCGRWRGRGRRRFARRWWRDLLRRATPLEAKYLLKLMLGDMRIGVKQSLVEEAIAVAAGGGSWRAVRHAVMLEADLGAAALRAFAGTLDEARMRLFHPLGFMLACPVETPEEAMERFTAKPPKRRGGEEAKADVEVKDVMRGGCGGGRVGGGCGEPEAATSGTSQTWRTAGGVQAFLEDKYDGMRAQVHCGDAAQPGRVAIYSRNREDITRELSGAGGGVRRRARSR